MAQHNPILAGKKALVVGIANEHSIAYGCAKRLSRASAPSSPSPTSTTRRSRTSSRWRGASRRRSSCRSTSSSPASSRRCSTPSKSSWGRLDILVHSIAFAPKEDLQGGLIDCSAEGFARAMDVSCHSFVRMAKLAAPLMTDGGTMFAMSYHGAQKVVPTTTSWAR